MEGNRTLFWGLGAIALVLLVGTFVFVLGGQPVGQPPTLSAADAMKQGNGFYGQGKFAEAAKMYKSALEADRNNVSAQVNLGNAYFALDRLDEAAEAFSTAADISPNDADIHSNYAAVLLRQGKLGDAQTQVKLALDANPKLAEAHYIQGVIFRQTGKLAEAVNEFKLAIAQTTDAKLKSEAEKQVAEINK